MKFSDLQEVQGLVNAAVTYTGDQETYGEREHWAIADTVGDCEDYALRKLDELLLRGWPIDMLRLATAWTEGGEYHAVLVVVGALDDQGIVGNWVLDNRAPDIFQPSYGFNGNLYKWHTIQQTGGSRTWVEFTLQ